MRGLLDLLVWSCPNITHLVAVILGLVLLFWFWQSCFLKHLSPSLTLPTSCSSPSAPWPSTVVEGKDYTGQLLLRSVPEILQEEVLELKAKPPTPFPLPANLRVLTNSKWEILEIHNSLFNPVCSLDEQNCFPFLLLLISSTQNKLYNISSLDRCYCFRISLDLM